MKKILLGIALLLALPMLANAEEATPKEHHMQNTNPAPAKPQEQVGEQAPEQAPEHVMRNSNPDPKQVQEKVHAPEHVMRNN